MTSDLHITLVRIIYISHGVIGSISMSSTSCRHHQDQFWPRVVSSSSIQSVSLDIFLSARVGLAASGVAVLSSHCVDVPQKLHVDGGSGW